ncbi:DUF4198 domain-containing protein [Emticicia aquatica]|nr:DUF4198 domain-containing protein [Emticicia aquatica]
MKKVSIILALLVVSLITFAHEFWLEPQKFLLSIGEKINFRVFVGENFTGEEVDFSKFEVAKFSIYSSKGEESIKGKLTEQNLSDFLKFDAEGNHLIAFNNTNKHIELEADKFNEYLKDDGLDNVLLFRKTNKQLKKRGTEEYQRCVKTLLQVENVHDETYRINTGMKLEIIPEQNPYLSDKSLTFKVLFDNKPLKNALVVVWQKGIEKSNKRNFRSDADGKITFVFEPKGIWMVSAVNMVPHSNPKEADWQSYWGSYTFGFN